ncbi:tyrosine-protein phosphatase non-receptor type substrate 1-like isoform X1 [Stegostoma tigrinum]|uniref:tyrosine-protein phosphatase non-receptor type substrate 1-like isoform X1 n=1 Tax=Stegostoma tigrinum TaxID=3053191 RepID=UPI0028707A1F|nr:tyrosine-protein phosphatase non-receptor type substrate 1-like isoform X1 [Stegostoma tigrinum]
MGAVLRLWLLVLGPVVPLEVIESPPVLSLLRGQTARIDCSLIPGEELADFVKYYWCRARDAPDLNSNISRIFVKNSPRVSVSMSESFLIIRELMLNDSDTYRCVVLREKPRPWKYFLGNGTTLNVQAKPEISLTADPENGDVGIQTLTCLAAGFFPRDLNISWIVEGDVSYQEEPGSLTVNSDSSYNLTSRLRITDPQREQGAAVSCLIEHRTFNGSVTASFSNSTGFFKYYYLGLLSPVLIVPFCLWVIRSQCCKLKSGKDSSVRGNDVDGQIMEESECVDNISLSSETLHYASVHVKNPSKSKQKQELKRPEQDQATEYAILKVKDKNNEFYKEVVDYSTVSICPTSNTRQTVNYKATTYASLKK